MKAQAHIQPVMAASPLPDNVYFAALEYGTSRMDGISYNEMVQYLKDNGKGWNDKLTESFCFWFFLNFYHEGATLAASRRLHAVPGTHFMRIEPEHLDAQAVLMGDAYMRYVDILELREARRASQIAEAHAKASITQSIAASISARTAFRLALVSFLVSACLSVAQIISAQSDESETLHEVLNTLRTGNEATDEHSSEVSLGLSKAQAALDSLVSQGNKPPEVAKDPIPGKRK